MEQYEMVPEGEPFQEKDSSPTPATSKENPPPKKTNVRKRTKSGCLTCRRRRIKCDEGKPTCNNCMKSKRQCEGYSQRVIFKEPMGSFSTAGLYGPVLYHADPPEPPLNIAIPPQPKSSSSQGPLPAIAPKPGPLGFPHPSAYRYGPTYLAQQVPHPIPAFGYEHAPIASQFPPQSAPFPTHSDPNAALVPGRITRDTLSAPHHVLYEIDGPQDHLSRAIPQQQPNLPCTEAGGSSSRQGNGIHEAEAYEQDDDYWFSDDDASMAESDDEISSEPPTAHLESNDLGVQVAKRLDAPFELYGTRMRTFSTLEDNVLDSYIPSSTSSPLNDPQTAAVFWHFVNVTGPSLSLYERHPLDPSQMFHGQPVPKAMQHIWTYTVPVISFNHPALMQAILAIASLQMAKLQGVPATASMKHYHLCIKRLAKNYSSMNKRTHSATLAATLLLGFYEVWQSDHDKWCKHMWGARAIIKEIPLKTMNLAVLNFKRKRRQTLSELRCQQTYDAFFTPFQYAMESDIDEVDTTLIGQLTGRHVSYEEDMLGDPSSKGAADRLTERDIDTFEHLSDLYWWFCKMDLYQSILGGTRLFMEYGLWTQCAPRAPMGRIDAVYGTMDHLILLIGRLANFASRDLARKRKAMKAEPGPAQGQSPPPFAGMMPSRGHVIVPTGFTPPRETSPRSDEADDMDLETSTAAAMKEWEAIKQAFEVFRSHLGPDFEPMGADIEPPVYTPFGPALTYRTYSIAGIMMNFFMGLVILHRAHPSMPPMAMMAAGMAAQQTAAYANEIGRVAAGLLDDDLSSITAVSTAVASAFIESGFCLFVAGVQYRDTSQRKWVINRLHEIARLTGWQSARQIADGCESAWTKAASLGRGPPWHREVSILPTSVWEGPRRVKNRLRELDEDEGRMVLARSERAHYAMGLLSVEQDLDRLDLEGDK